jgi:hypothetical protein
LEPLAKHLDPEPQSEVGVPHHHDEWVSADHGAFAGDLSLPAVLVVVEALNKVDDFINGPRQLLGEKTVEEIGASVAKVWDQFKEDAAQVIEDVMQQMTELVSPEKTQDQASIERQSARDGAAEERQVNGDAPAGRSDAADQPDTGRRTQDKVQPDAPDPEMTALHDKQTKELADQAALLAEQRRKFADSPDKLETLKLAAAVNEGALAAKHAAESRKFLEQRQLQQQQIHQQQISNPPDPSRNR